MSEATTPEPLGQFAAAWNVQIMEEASIPKGAELCSPPARGPEFRRLMRDWDYVAWVSGADYTRKCGLHVHVDARDYTYADVVRLLALWGLVEPWMFGRIDKARWGTKYAVPIAGGISNIRRMALDPNLSWQTSRRALAEYLGGPVRASAVRRPKKTKGGAKRGFFLDDHEESNEIRYRALNILAWALQGSVEFRLAPGTVNMRLVEDWACLLSALVDLGRDRTHVRPFLEAADPVSVCAELHRRSGLDPTQTAQMEHRWHGQD